MTITPLLPYSHTEAIALSNHTLPDKANGPDQRSSEGLPNIWSNP